MSAWLINIHEQSCYNIINIFAIIHMTHCYIYSRRTGMISIWQFGKLSMTIMWLDIPGGLQIQRGKIETLEVLLHFFHFGINWSTGTFYICTPMQTQRHTNALSLLFSNALAHFPQTPGEHFHSSAPRRTATNSLTRKFAGTACVCITETPHLTGLFTESQPITHHLK